MHCNCEPYRAMQGVAPGKRSDSRKKSSVVKHAAVKHARGKQLRHSAVQALATSRREEGERHTAGPHKIGGTSCNTDPLRHQKCMSSAHMVACLPEECVERSCASHSWPKVCAGV